MADIHLQPEPNAQEGYKKAIETVNKLNPDFVITGGDLVMDVITTSLPRVLGEFVGEKIKEEGIKQENWGSTCSYSPGQFKWTIEEQKKYSKW